MQSGYSRLHKIRFCFNVGLSYILTIAFICYVISISPLIAHAQTNNISQKPLRPVATDTFNVISGLPIRIVIPNSSVYGRVVDLQVVPGYYNPSSQSWNLSGYQAQFAMLSSLANNYSGDTYIYGHNNDNVFGALRRITPSLGAPALIYTSNGHIFSYSFESVLSYPPTDTLVLINHAGPPTLTIQTCTGGLNEWRTLYKFKFVKVIQ